MLTKLSSGNYEIINSGTVLLCGKDPDLLIEMSFSSGFKMNLKLLFIEDDTKKQELNTKIEKDTLIINSINFNNSLGTGMSSPISVATVDGRKVYLHMWSYLLSETTRKVEYTVLWEKKECPVGH